MELMDINKPLLTRSLYETFLISINFLKKLLQNIV